MNSRHFCWVNSMKDRKKPAIRFKGFTEDWEQRKLDNIAKIKTLELLFLELGMELKVFWQNHFGVVNVDETVKIDEIAVF